MSQGNFDKLASKILDESLRLQKGEAITIETWNNGLPFARRVLIEAKKRGAHPLLLMEDEEAFIEAAKTVSEENLGHMGKHEYNLLASTNAYVFIPGPPIGTYTKAVTPQRKAVSTAYNNSWYEAAEKAGLRGARLSFGYVDHDLASVYGKKADTMAALQIKASLVDYRQIGDLGRKIAAQMEDSSEASVASKGELRLSLKGDIVIEDGIVDEQDIAEGNNVVYVPPGRVQKGVDPNSLSGEAEFSSALTTWGLVEGIKVRFKEGTLQAITCRRGGKNLQRWLDTIPAEKRRVSSVEIGLNPVLKYRYGQDRFVSGSVTVNLPRLAAVAEKATLTIRGKEQVRKGRLV